MEPFLWYCSVRAILYHVQSSIQLASYTKTTHRNRSLSSRRVVLQCEYSIVHPIAYSATRTPEFMIIFRHFRPWG